MSIHQPVLLKEVIAYLEPKPGENFIDCTFGSGGHTREILKRIAPEGRLLGIDADKEIRSLRSLKLGNSLTSLTEINLKNLILVNDNFVNLKNIYEHNFPYPVSGILFDLGFSSIQLEKSGRGFSFLRDECLDMRFDVNQQELTAAEILNSYGEKELFKVFREFGEVKENKAKRIAKAVMQRRRKKHFKTTYDFVQVILSSLYADAFKRKKITVNTKQFYHHHKKVIHPATKFFQALRIEVNNELDNLVKALPQAVEILKSGGRLVVISFHSLEDRIVKHFFKEVRGVRVLTKKPVASSEEEIKQNPRARSAKMRVIEKI